MDDCCGPSTRISILIGVLHSLQQLKEMGMAVNPDLTFREVKKFMRSHRVEFHIKSCKHWPLCFSSIPLS